MKKLISISLIVLATTLSGCAGLSYAVKNYSGVDVTSFDFGGVGWRVFEKRNEGRLMITPSLGRAMSGGMKNGFAFNFSNEIDSENRFRNAAKAFIEEKHGLCRITSGKVVVQPQYEYFYEC